MCTCIIENEPLFASVPSISNNTVLGRIFLRIWLLSSLVYECCSQSSSQVNLLHITCLSTWGLCLSGLWLDFNLANQSTKVIPPYLLLTLNMSSSFLDHSQHILTKGHICPTSSLLSYSQELSCKKFLEGGKLIFVSWKIHKVRQRKWSDCQSCNCT